MEAGMKTVDEMAKASKQTTETMRALLQELAKMQMRLSSEERDRQTKAVFNANMKAQDMARLEVSQEIAPALENALRQKHIPYVPFNFKHVEGRKNRDDIRLIIVRPQDLEDAEIYLRTIEEMRRTDYRKDYRLFMQNNLGEMVMKIPIRNEPEWEHQFQKNAKIMGFDYAIKETEKGKEMSKDIYIQLSDKAKASKAIFMTEWDLKGRAGDLVRHVAAKEIEVKQAEKERLSNVVEKGGVYICKLNPMGERLLIESDRFVHYDRNGKEIASDDRRENPGTYDYKLQKKIDHFMRSNHVLVDAAKLDGIIRDDPHSQPEYLLRENSDQVNNELNRAIAVQYKVNRVEITPQERAVMEESQEMRNAVAKEIHLNGLTFSEEAARNALSAAMQLQNEAFVQAREEAMAAGDASMVANLEEHLISDMSVHLKTVEQIRATMKEMDIDETGKDYEKGERAEEFKVSKEHIIMFMPEEIEKAEKMEIQRIMERAEALSQEQPEREEIEEPAMEFEEFSYDGQEPEMDEEEPELFGDDM